MPDIQIVNPMPVIVDAARKLLPLVQQLIVLFGGVPQVVVWLEGIAGVLLALIALGGLFPA